MIPFSHWSPKKAMFRSVVIFVFWATPFPAQSQELKYGLLPYPEVNAETWVLIEIWPAVHDITLSAYFMDFSSGKNMNLCEATKRALDRDAATLAKEQVKVFSSYRQCYKVADAVKAGYISTEKD